MVVEYDKCIEFPQQAILGSGVIFKVCLPLV